jgi:uncharacterized protein (TIGR03382 family)
MSSPRSLACALLWLMVTAAGNGEAAADSRPHVLLTPALRARWQALASVKGSSVEVSIRHCADVAARPAEFAPSGYQQLDWAKHLQACLVAWAATPDAAAADAHAKVAMTYFTAMLDDRDRVGDGAGGDTLVSQDSGFAIRAIGPYTALAYDWLHDHPLMNEDLRATARHRFKAWTDWFAASGYRARDVGNNYHAGYVIGATLMAAAQRGDAGADGDALWRKVTDEIWGIDMARGLTSGGVLEGGDWGEGWQYGPLAVASYAVAGRVLQEAGVTVPGLGAFFDAVLARHVHALSPAGGVFVAGDTQVETANLEPNPNTLAAVAIAAATPAARAAALGELQRLRLLGPDVAISAFPLLVALAEGSATPAPLARAGLPTWYLAPGTGNLYARTGWDDGAVWTVMQCTPSLEIDHFHADAGNVVLTRGRDDLLVDPSPYGTLSTLTSNAPTVASAHLPANYIPGQGYWSVTTRWEWAHQSVAGVVAARCDYADQYKFQHRPSDVPHALRDLVLVPWRSARAGDPTDATLIVVDRAESGSANRPLYTRWRLPGVATVSPDRAATTVGDSALTVARLASSSGEFERGVPSAKDCFGEGVPRGNCDAARFPVVDARLTVAGPSMRAVHVLDVGAAKATPTPTTLTQGAGWNAAWIDRGERAAIVVTADAPPWQGPAASLTYRAPARGQVHHVVLDPPGAPERVAVAARKDGADCEVTLTPGGEVAARPVHLSLDAACQVTLDPVMASSAQLVSVAAGAAGSDGVDHGTAGRATPRSPRSGCCGGAQASGSATLPMALLVAAALGRRRRRGRP